ncbi:hypothetical protein P7C73_g4226, partial [Tremellales sp. Uapishka_1]
MTATQSHSSEVSCHPPIFPTANTDLAHSQNRHSISSDDSGMVDINSLSLHSPSDEFEHLYHPSAARPAERKARLLYCKSHVAIHPTAFHRDNITGYLGIVEVAEQKDGKKEILVFWVPDELLDRMDEDERGRYRKVEERLGKEEVEEDGECLYTLLCARLSWKLVFDGKADVNRSPGFVFVTVPPPRGEKYAFSVPVTGIYSILVYAPSLSHWHGSATLNLMGGVSLPTLFFHDDLTPTLLTPSTSSSSFTTPEPRVQWGFPPFLTLLRAHAVLLRSCLVTNTTNRGAELYLINPSKSDREVHEHVLEETSYVRERTPSTSTPASDAFTPYPPPRSFPNNAMLGQTSPRQTILTSLSNLTNLSRKSISSVLSHPLAQPVVPHLPPAVRSLINVPGEWERNGRVPPKKGGPADVATEFEAARLYLARWARVVAEEGERARRDEVASRAGLASSGTPEDMTSSLGVFSLLSNPNSKRPVPTPTRLPQSPITLKDWESFAAQGRDEFWVRGEIFRRGFSDTDSAKQARKEGWEVLLGIIPWDLGGVGGGDSGKETRRKERQEAREAKRAEYGRLKEKWRLEWMEAVEGREGWRDEWHRIDQLPFLDTTLAVYEYLPIPHPSFPQVDCRRTDRNQALYAVPNEAVKSGDEEKEGGGVGDIRWDGKGEKEEEGGMAGLNPHIAALRTILMTYHTYSPDLGYVQGMSDLLSPIYVVFEAEEGGSFWGLVGLMKMMESNFLRDQSGMKRQLSTLQQLIGVMDPELYAHLERTESLNLFFCFRWILIAFKREFKFDNVIKLWEILWTNCYSNQFVLFVALAVLQSHRDVLIRYLTEFDEVLKYANDLSGTVSVFFMRPLISLLTHPHWQIDLDTTLAQAEVLFLSFKGLVEDLDRENKNLELPEGLRRRKEDEAVVKKKTIAPDLRDLLIGWKEETL